MTGSGPSSIWNLSTIGAQISTESVLRVGSDSLRLEVSDDGRGITQREQRGSHSLGLLGLRERAIAWGGTLSVSGSPSAGTTVSLQLPMPAGTS